MVGVEQAFGCGAPDDLREFPAEVDRVLHAEVETLATGGNVDMGRIACQEDPAYLIVLNLA